MSRRISDLDAHLGTQLLVRTPPPAIPVQLVHAAHAIGPQKLRAFMDFVTPRLRLTLKRVERTLASARPFAVNQAS